ncbi:MAG: acetyl-CoA carboxylase biotin carboxyl carrier protein subunit [Deltaproteobacteria bacterium]|nr:acetyl-CoA carboxylase biotin carboxyl carrier protein subunit [Deltaproteobacteria bacterium]
MATEVRTPLKGRVVRFLVEVGAQVEEEEPIIEIEALKMKMPVAAPCDGLLTEYRVQPGQEVETNTVLAIIG